MNASTFLFFACEFVWGRQGYTRPSDIVKEFDCTYLEACLVLQWGEECGRLGKRRDGRYYANRTAA